MPTIKDFIEDQVNPPTLAEEEWATENFSSRVDPPTDPACLTAPVIDDNGYDMQVIGLEVHCLFIGHNLVDVPFDDEED